MTEVGLQHRFSMFSEDYFRTINQTGVRQRIGLAGLAYSGCWDTRINPSDGVLYYAPSSATGHAEHTRLVAYDYDSDSAKICFKAEDLVLPTRRQFPVTKLHESLTILPDGRIFATTHSTDRSPDHPEWMPFAHYTHVWEGWPGSNMLCYDPRTGHTEMGVQCRGNRSTARHTTRSTTPSHDRLHGGHVYRFSARHAARAGISARWPNFLLRLHVVPTSTSTAAPNRATSGVSTSTPSRSRI